MRLFGNVHKAFSLRRKRVLSMYASAQNAIGLCPTISAYPVQLSKSIRLARGGLDAVRPTLIIFRD